jgi:type IV pilus assembly protein PilZ
MSSSSNSGSGDPPGNAKGTPGTEGAEGQAPAQARSPSQDSWNSEKRYDGRAAISLRVDYKRINTFFADYTKNISKGGTFIRTTKPLDVGTEFVFVLSVPSHNKQLELNADVMWVVTEEKATPETPAGMGIKFKFIDDGERDLVDGFVEKLMDEALGSHISQKLLRRDRP